MWSVLALVLLLARASLRADSQLTSDFYDQSCPEILSMVRQGVERAFAREQRIAASLLRLHFHDCFVNVWMIYRSIFRSIQRRLTRFSTWFLVVVVAAPLQGCDASILLDDTSSFTGEKTAAPNLNSARGFDVVDEIKSEVERSCPGIVSCADILAIAARDSVSVASGPSWEVVLGRRDSLGASINDANRFIPSPASDVPALVSAFQAVGLSGADMIVLSGAHTIGAARCGTLTPRLYNQSGTGQPDPITDPDLLDWLQRLCPQGGNPATLAALDVQTPQDFDNSYYRNLLSGRGILHSDQVLFSGDGSSSQAVQALSNDESLFFSNFARSMVRMGNIAPLTGSSGEIRRDCRFSNET